jgi:hypothetical protein
MGSRDLINEPEGTDIQAPTLADDQTGPGVVDTTGIESCQPVAQDVGAILVPHPLGERPGLSRPIRVIGRGRRFCGRLFEECC